MPNPSGSSCIGNRSSFQAHLALEETRSLHSPKTVLLWKQASTRQRRLRGGPAWLASVRSTRATAANHRQLISACRRDELGVANSNVTSEVTDHTCPQHSWRPARAPAESRVRSVRPLD